MKKTVVALFLICILFVACDSQSIAYIDYPGNTGIPIEEGLTDIPEEVYTQTGAENGLSGTVYSVVGTVKEVSRGESGDYFVITTERGDVWVGDASEITVKESLALGCEIDLSQLKSYYPLPSVGEKVRVAAQYSGMNGVIGLPAFTYGTTDYLTMALMLSTGSLDEFIDSNTTKVPSTDEELSTATPPEKGTAENPYTAGMYKVGSDLPAGEYLFYATTSNYAYVCASIDSNQNDIVENENFNGSFFMTVVNGQYLEATRCCFIKASEGMVELNEDGSIGEGTYRVGIDIPAGEYKLTTEEDSAYWCLYLNSNIPFDIYDNNIFEGSAYVTVRDGQYLMITRCTAEPT